MRGRISKQGEPIVPVALHGSGKRGIDAILDTGFTGHLCLARRHRHLVKLTRMGNVEIELADGTRVTPTAYRGRVTFAGETREVLVTLTRADDSLIGTSLLAGRRVLLDFRRHSVRID
jgi:predicted aspartyl protease